MAHILVIKHGALGDMFQAFSAFASLRHAFPDDHLSLLTSSPYISLAQKSPWFDSVIVDNRPKLTDWRALLSLYRHIRRFDRVFDLQNSGRTRLYFRFTKPPFWSGQIPQANAPHLNPMARQMHTLTRQNDQLLAAGITPRPREVPMWLVEYGPIITEPYVVLVPGAASHRPAKQWPIEHFSALATYLKNCGLTPVIVGAPAHKSLGTSITQHVPNAIDLTGQTSLIELSGLIHQAHFVIGNDTGPMHIAATMDRPSLTLFSSESDPRRCAPLSLTPGYSQMLLVDDLTKLTVERVTAYLASWPLLKLEPQRKRVQSPTP
ncbi:ADP-heptose--LPS heptosyltransferase [Saccharibacter sp. 17.LH.SD]|uniref:glycosyltransferase family 9 protein n=1 Tax=Saccharibacter sp. 17.LH.SD TaxID=2689393 RepID=UPI00136E904C|nr:glycosyltransferase family 9 protein [Saccharibacter sp. 17.LH.SD]MXV43746.1 ADP-heptose--LPS heptosyltransferase [Saccharibacter sp. 17.LH.SD]